MGSGYTVSLFTDWQDQKMYQMWIKIRGENGMTSFLVPPQELFGAKLQSENVNLVRGFPPENCTEQMGVPGTTSGNLIFVSLHKFWVK
jgi:xylitol oxidase